MRPGQQNRRMRGRNNNRKGPNPLTRNYESNGPDVKIRGSAQQIAEKYASLARDAQSSGDRVMAENYLQHAEHYNRIIMAAQAQMPIQPVRDNRDDFDDEVDEEREEMMDAQPAPERPREFRPQPPRHDDGSGPQPTIEGVPAEVALKQQNAGADNGGERGPEARVNGSYMNGSEPGEGGQRRGRRPRRGPRGPRGEQEGAAEGGEQQHAAGYGNGGTEPEAGNGGETAAEQPQG